MSGKPQQAQRKFEIPFPVLQAGTGRYSATFCQLLLWPPSAPLGSQPGSSVGHLTQLMLMRALREGLTSEHLSPRDTVLAPPGDDPPLET
ncbi:unnamed protein product [Gadus morhua 'NCC']